MKVIIGYWENYKFIYSLYSNDKELNNKEINDILNFLLNNFKTKKSVDGLIKGNIDNISLIKGEGPLNEYPNKLSRLGEEYSFIFMGDRWSLRYLYDNYEYINWYSGVEISYIENI